MHSTPSDVIAAQVRERRTRLGLNREQLAARCAQLGAPQLTLAALTNIETGRRNAEGKRRREVSADELLVLARALQAPPILLLFPLGRGDSIEVSPGVSAPTWPALKWFSGEAEFPHWQDRDEDGNVVAEVAEATDTDAWRQGAVPIQLYRSHERHVEEWQVGRRRAAYFRSQAARSELSEEGRLVKTRDAEVEERGARVLEGLVWEERRKFRQLGMTPPDLPESLSDLDDETSALYRQIEADYKERQERDRLRLERDRLGVEE